MAVCSFCRATCATSNGPAARFFRYSTDALSRPSFPGSRSVACTATVGELLFGKHRAIGLRGRATTYRRSSGCLDLRITFLARMEAAPQAEPEDLDLCQRHSVGGSCVRDLATVTAYRVQTFQGDVVGSAWRSG